MYNDGDTLKVISTDSWIGWAKKLIDFKFILKSYDGFSGEISMSKKELQRFKLWACPRVTIRKNDKELSYCRMLLVEKV